MNNLRIPAWLVAVALFVLIAVVLERLYHAKVPVKIFGIELNQPPTTVSTTTLRIMKPVTVRGSDKQSLGVKENEGFCYLTYVQGNFGGGEFVKVFVENDTWMVESHEGRPGLGVQATAQCVEFSTEGSK